jgi:predicted nucleotidyltransferase/HEPN domain-containing protein
VKTGIDHLPAAKQRELERIVAILFEEFELAQANAIGKRQSGRILKVVLFGSYARGGWVDEPHTAKGYQSDYDLLLIVNRNELTDRVAYWQQAEERLIRDLSITKTLRTPVNFIVHTLQEVNDGLAHGRYFFMDIAKDGIALYQNDDSELHTPKPKTPSQALCMAKEYFEEWLPSSSGFMRNAGYAQRDGDRKLAAFLLHQATERLYHCVLLVLTFYTPHVHNIAFLRSQAERLDARLIDAWPRGSREHRAMFEKLKDAYVKARYSKHYKIDAGELEWLEQCVETLGQIVHAVCSDRIAELKAKLTAAQHETGCTVPSASG